MGCLGGGWLAGSLAERYSAHQHNTARPCRPDAVALGAAVPLEVEGVESSRERGGHRHFPISEDTRHLTEHRAAPILLPSPSERGPCRVDPNPSTISPHELEPDANRFAPRAHDPTHLPTPMPFDVQRLTALDLEADHPRDLNWRRGLQPPKDKTLRCDVMPSSRYSIA
jgi:hypothetical protein